MLYNGTVFGRVTSFVPNSQLSLKWRMKGWTEQHFSKVEISIKEAGDVTKLTLTQSEIPSSDFERTVSGWKENYWKPINSVFGYGSNFGSF